MAAVLSFIIPGLGYMLRGRVGIGLLWLGCTTLGYICFIVPGLILHIICIVQSSKLDKLDAAARPAAPRP